MLKRIIPFNKRFLSNKFSSENINKIKNNHIKRFSVQESKITKTDNVQLNHLSNINKIISESLKNELDNFYPIDENQLKQILNERGLNLLSETDSKTIILEKKLEEKMLRLIITPKQPDIPESENESNRKISYKFF